MTVVWVAGKVKKNSVTCPNHLRPRATCCTKIFHVEAPPRQTLTLTHQKLSPSWKLLRVHGMQSMGSSWVHPRVLWQLLPDVYLPVQDMGDAFFFDFWIEVCNMYLELWSARSGMLPAFAPTFELLVFWKVRYIRAERLWKWSNKPDQKPWSESSLMFHIDICSISFGNVIQNSILKTKTRMGPPKPVWCSGPWNWGDSCMTTHNDLTIDHGYWED